MNNQLAPPDTRENQVRSAWGAFKAARMTGMEDRGDFYKFWYNVVDLEPGETTLASWKASVETGSFFRVGGNLLLTDRRLILEPMSNGRVADAPYGMKPVINSWTKWIEHKAPPVPVAELLTDLTFAARNRKKKATLAVTNSEGWTCEFFLSTLRFPIGNGHVQRRDEALARMRAVAAEARLRA